MNKIRIIPRLDIKGPNLVKGIHLEGLRVLGKPEKYAKFYYKNGADELFFQDAVASLYERNSLSDIISKTAKEIFIPLTVGGGIRTIQDIKNVLRAGADKVAINTAAVKNPEFIKEASLKFGSSTIVVAIEAIKQYNGQYLAYTDNGREESSFEVVSWARRVEELGAGEIVITSVDKEGTGEGFDLKLIKMIAETVSIPVIAHGGCSGPQDAAKIIIEGGADAVAVSSILHYKAIAEINSVYESFEVEGNTSFMESGMIYNKIKPCTIHEVKNEMKNSGIAVRL
jgi:cyclase